MTTSDLLPLVCFASGFALGAGALWLALRGRAASQQQLLDSFKALAADTLHQNSAAFLQMAEGKLQTREQAAVAQLDKKTVAIDAMIKPVQETLQKMDAQLQALEVKREGAYRELAQMVTASHETQQILRNETGQLLQALRMPTARGRWGELQLQRILEMTGMATYAHDFDTQSTHVGEDGKIRPDVIVALPGQRCVVIDSKVPLTAYLDALQCADDASRAAAIKQHARHLKDHIKGLSAKEYWNKIEGTPEFVVLFLPGEQFLTAALEGDGDLVDFSGENHIVLATPMTLIALLRAASYGWQQQALQDNVKEVADLAKVLYSSLNKFSEHLDAMGSRLGGAVDYFNKAVGSLERNVLGKARRLAEYGATSEEEALAPPEQVDREPRLTIIAGSRSKTSE